MKSLWNENEAKEFSHSAVSLRAYSSRLLGGEEELVLHGGGNTSVKDKVINLFGEEEDILFVKGSGHDLKTIRENGFAPVKMNVLLKLAALSELTDTNMVKELKAAMIDTSAPGPSIEAIPHAIIPFKYVDHTHADAVVAISNTPRGRKRIEDIYGDEVLVLDFGMPGFLLSQQIYHETRDVDWSQLKGIILLHHGVFTFADEAKIAYENMIDIVDKAENYLKKQNAWEICASQNKTDIDVTELAMIRHEVSKIYGAPMICRAKLDDLSRGMACLKNADEILTRGPITPDHVIRTKRVAAVLDCDFNDDLKKFTADYEKYFEQHNDGTMTILDKAPRFAVWKNRCMLAMGADYKQASIISDIVDHTIKAIQWGEALESWQALPAKDVFDLEYWELEQAKLKKAGSKKVFTGKVALVTGGASGIGLATAKKLLDEGACVVSLDIKPAVVDCLEHANYLGIETDITNEAAIKEALSNTVLRFGGLDILVTNAGSFPSSQKIQELDNESFNKILTLNLTSHLIVIRESIPFLQKGFDPTIIVVGSKNVPAPGPGVAAYSVAKAGLTQLARVAALELGAENIRVNTIHPNAIFDTGIWDEEKLAKRAIHYGKSVDEYKKSNILRTEINSSHVADLISVMASPAFAKTTGAQVPIDGGNERVI